MKNKGPEIFHQALADATHKPSANWKKEITKAEKVKSRRQTKAEIVNQIESLSEGIDWSYSNLMKTDASNLQNILQLLKIRNTLK